VPVDRARVAARAVTAGLGESKYLLKTLSFSIVGK
jgi:hypothetical protein